MYLSGILITQSHYPLPLNNNVYIVVYIYTRSPHIPIYCTIED